MKKNNNALRILIYCQDFLPSVGGVQTSVNLLAKGLTERSPATLGAGPPKMIVTVATQTPSNGLNDSDFAFRVVRRPSLWTLVRLIWHADVIHLAGPCLLPMAVASIIAKPAVVEHHGYQAVCPNGLLFREPSRAICPGYFIQKKYRSCLKCSSETMGFSGAIRSLVLMFPRYWLSRKMGANVTITDHVAKRINLPNMRTIYYGIESPNASTTPAKPDSSETIQIAYVGRLVPEKGLPLLLGAAKRLSDRGVEFQLTFVGDGPERVKLENMSRSLFLEDRVRFTGDLRGADLDRVVSGIGVVVMPSVWEETAGLSAIEHMMRGRVVVAADIGGLAEVVGESGLKFVPGDEKALTDCLERIVSDQSLADSLGRAARERASRYFQRGDMIEMHAELYDSLRR